MIRLNGINKTFVRNKIEAPALRDINLESFKMRVCCRYWSFGLRQVHSIKCARHDRGADQRGVSAGRSERLPT